MSEKEEYDGIHSPISTSREQMEQNRDDDDGIEKEETDSSSLSNYGQKHSEKPPNGHNQDNLSSTEFVPTSEENKHKHMPNTDNTMSRSRCMSDLEDGIGDLKISEQKQTKQSSQTDGQDKPTTSASGKIQKETSLSIEETNKINKARKAIIINNITFEENEKREGNEKDSEKASTLFKNLGFTPKVYTDLKEDVMRQNISTVAKDNEYNNLSDCFACMLMSHGNETSIETSDSKLVNLQDVFADFYPDKCTSLGDKPKLFFIQACRGTAIDRGHGKTNTVSPPTMKVPNAKDFLIHYATPPGFKAFRSPEGSAYFVQALAETVENDSNREVFHLLTEVNMKVSELEFHYENDDTKQIPFISSTLTKQLYLRDNISYTTAIKPQSSDNKYDMEHKDRGMAVIIDTVKCKHEDKKTLVNLFQDWLGFTIKQDSDMTFIKNGEEPKNAKSSDCFVCVLLMKYPSDIDQHISDILHYFKKCNDGLRGKPKILFIVSCQPSVITQEVAKGDARPFITLPSKPKLIPEMADILVVVDHEPKPYKADLKNTEIESEFVKELDSALKNNDLKDCNFLNLITRVFGETTKQVQHNMKHVPYFMSTLRKDLFLKHKERNPTRINIPHDDAQQCNFTDMKVLSDGRLALTDVGSKCIIILDQNFKVVSADELPSRPWSIAEVGKDQLVCTLPEKLKIQFMSVFGICDRHIDTKVGFLGIVHIQDKLIVRDGMSVQVLDMHGEIIKNLYNGEVKYMAISSDHTILYISGGSSNTVTSLTLEGKVLATYTDKQLIYPRGVTVDDEGSVYVCGSESNNIHLLTHDLSKGRVLYVYQDKSQPHVIAYRENKLYVGSYKSSYIDVFKLQ